MNALRRLALAAALTLAASTPAATAAALPADNPEIERLKAEDQADRQPGVRPIDGSALQPRDAARRADVLRLLRSGGVRTATDHFNAALILQHGDGPDDYRLAYALATMATALDDKGNRARWLQAASWDRLLVSLGRPQWYGTQFRRGEDGLMALLSVKPGAVTDADRAAFNVPPLATAQSGERWGAGRDEGNAACFPSDFATEVIERASKDQAARRALLANVASKPLHDVVLALDRENTDWLRPIVAQCGWPGQSEIGEQAAHDIWLIAQHADTTPAFQIEAATAMHRQALEGEASGRRVALLVDRHARLQDIPQTYGMQFNVDDGVLRFLPIDAPDELDDRRRELGLTPFACWAAEAAASSKATLQWPANLPRSTCEAE